MLVLHFDLYACIMYPFRMAMTVEIMNMTQRKFAIPDLILKSKVLRIFEKRHALWGLGFGVWGLDRKSVV